MNKKILTFLTIGSLILSVGCSGTTGTGPIQNDTVKVNQYKELKIDKVNKDSVLEEDVINAIEDELEEHSETSTVDREAKEGDIINIDYKGMIDGKAFEGGTAKDQNVEIGAGAYIPAEGKYKGFEEQLIGHKAGDKFSIKVKFPKDYAEELADKVAEFKIKVNKVGEKKKSELSDDWVRSISSTAKTVDEYKKEIRKELEKEADENYRQQIGSEIFDALEKQTEWIKKPEDEIKEEVEKELAKYEKMAKENNMSVDEFYQQQIGKTQEEFKKQLTEDYSVYLKQLYAVKLIAEKENIKVNDIEYKEKLQELATQYGYKNEKAMEEEIGEKDLRDYVLQEKVLDFLIDNCKQMEKSIEENTETMDNSDTSDKENQESISVETQQEKKDTAKDAGKEQTDSVSEGVSNSVSETTDK